MRLTRRARFKDFLVDLFKGPGNVYWDLGRIIVFGSAALMTGAALWNIHLGKDIDLGPSGLGGGLAALLTAGAALIAAKDLAAGKVAPVA